MKNVELPEFVLDMKEKFMNTNPIIRNIIIILAAPNGVLVGLSIVIAKLVSAGYLPAIPVM